MISLLVQKVFTVKSRQKKAILRVSGVTPPLTNKFMSAYYIDKFYELNDVSCFDNMFFVVGS